MISLQLIITEIQISYFFDALKENFYLDRYGL